MTTRSGMLAGLGMAEALALSTAADLLAKSREIASRPDHGPLGAATQLAFTAGRFEDYAELLRRYSDVLAKDGDTDLEAVKAACDALADKIRSILPPR